MFSSRDYYGTIKHNSRAVYQGYLGWYDGNPAHLDPLPDAQRAAGYVKLAGGAEQLLAQAQAAFDEANYRWVAELLNHLVFTDPSNLEARKLLARTYDQLGYQAESGPWRDAYLTGALELREGTPDAGIDIASMKDIFLQTPVAFFFDTLAVRLKADSAENKDWRIKIQFTDLDKHYLLWLENSVLHHRLLPSNSVKNEQADAGLTLTRSLFIEVLIGEVGLKETLFSDELSIDGSKVDLLRFFSLFEKPITSFGIVLPD